MKFSYKKYGYILFFTFIAISIFDIRFAIGAAICMVAPIVLAILGKGRYWCGNFCPRGNFYDNIMKKFSPNKKVPRLLKSKIFRTFVVIFMMTMFYFGVKNSWGDLKGIGMVFYRMIIVTSLIGIILSFFFNHRTWCNFCPMGSISSFITVLRGKKTALEVEDSCVSCNLCSKVCPMGVEPKAYKGGIIKDNDCINCGECALKCPKQSIS